MSPSDPHSPAPSGPPKPTLWKRFSGSKFFLVSVGVHLLIGLVATVLVVQTITAKRKLTFKGGPPSPNPSQRSVEHRVQMAKKQQTMSAPSQPKRVTTTNALAKVSLPDMPALPSLGPTTPSKMAGMGGTGMGQISGGAGLAPGSVGGGGLTMFGLRNATQDALKGTFYDLKQTKDGKPTDMDDAKWAAFVQAWVKGSWNESELRKYFAGPNPLYAPYLFVPIINADEGPKAFALQDKVKPRLWVAHYKAKVVSPSSGRFRFVGLGDDILIIRFNGSVVFAQGRVKETLASPPVRYSYENLKNISGDRGPVAGKWFEVSAGGRYDMEVLIGECPGGLMHAYLLLEKMGGVYDKDPAGLPILPLFRVSKLVPTVKPDDKLPPFSTKETPWSIASGVGFTH
ncbi:MAG: hypothetical protein ABIT76_02035 [Chthoniobacterales bacterium]